MPGRLIRTGMTWNKSDNRDVTLLRHNRLTFAGQCPVQECLAVFRQGLSVVEQYKRAGYGVLASGDGIVGRFNTVHFQCFQAAIDSTQGDVTDCRRVLRHSGFDHTVTTGHLGAVGNSGDHVTVCILDLQAHDVFERAAGTGSRVTGYDDDGLVIATQCFPVGDFTLEDASDLLGGQTW